MHFIISNVNNNCLWLKAEVLEAEVRPSEDTGTYYLHRKIFSFYTGNYSVLELLL